MRDVYTLSIDGDKLTFKTVLYRSGDRSALNRMVYNRDLSAILLAGTAAATVYYLLLQETFAGLQAWIALGALFIPFYLVVRFWLLKERVLDMVADRESGTIVITTDKISGKSRKEIALKDVSRLETEELAPLDESDLADIVAWHKIAEPGVHATPLPLFKLNILLVDGSKILILTDIINNTVVEAKKSLDEFMGLV